MDVKIYFSSRVLEVEDVDGFDTWEELCDFLYESDLIDEFEYTEAMASSHFRESISSELILTSSEESQSGKPRTGAITFGDPPKETPPSEDNIGDSPPVSQKPITFGDSKSKESPPVKSKTGAITFGVPLEETSTSEEEIPPVEKQVIAESSEPPPVIKVRRKGDFYEMSLKCSKSGETWIATLFTNQGPVSIKTKPRKSTPSSFTLNIVVDDSTSMNKGGAADHLRKALIQFLSERPSSDRICFHSFNRTGWNKTPSAPDAAKSEFTSYYNVGGWTHMNAALKRLNVSKGDIVIFFSDGTSTDGSPVPLANKIKNDHGVRFITIGCGSAVKTATMKQMASSKKDYHHAKNPGKLLDVFSKVSKSLMQDRPKIVSKGDKKGKNHAEQVSSSRQSTDASDQGVSSSTKLAANQGFSFIENFLCHCCGDKQRLVCGECNQNLCGGGLTNNQVTCPTCNNVSEVELSDQAIGGVGKSSKGKGK